MRQLVIAALSLVTAGLTTSAIAETGFPIGYQATVAGVSIGDTFEQANASIREVMPIDIEEVARPTELIHLDATHREGTRYSDKMVISPVSGEPFPIYLRASFVAENGRRVDRLLGNDISMSISSPATGNKVEAITRRQSFRENPLNHDAVIEKIYETYGTPHAISDDRNVFYYGFLAGEPIPGNQDRDHFHLLISCTNPETSARNMSLEGSSGMLVQRTNLSAHFEGSALQPETPFVERCEAGMKISLSLQEGLVDQMNFTILDHLAMHVDQVAFLSEIAKAKENEVSPTGQTEVPKF